MLEISEPDDAALAMRGALVVSGCQALDPQRADSAPRQPMQRRGAGRAESHHDHVELRHRPTSDCERKHPCLVWRQAALKDRRVHAAPMAHDARTPGMELL